MIIRLTKNRAIKDNASSLTINTDYVMRSAIYAPVENFSSLIALNFVGESERQIYRQSEFTVESWNLLYIYFYGTSLANHEQSPNSQKLSGL